MLMETSSIEMKHIIILIARTNNINISIDTLYIMIITKALSKEVLGEYFDENLFEFGGRYLGKTY